MISEDDESYEEDSDEENRGNKQRLSNVDESSMIHGYSREEDD